MMPKIKEEQIMYSVSIKSESYSKTIAYLSFMTALCAFGCILFGYITLPFASAFYAALLLFEQKEKRVLSYVIPIIAFILNFALRGFSLIGLMSLEAVAYILLGVIIYFSYTLSQSKAACAFYTSAATVVMMCISLVFLAFTALKAFGASVVVQFYSHIYNSVKNVVVNSLVAISNRTEEGIRYFLLNRYDAEIIFDQMVVLLIPITMIFAFIISGIALKLFTSIVSRRTKPDSPINTWSFKTPTSVAVFYLIVSVISLFSYGASDLFSVSISALSSVFMVVYAYVGLTFAHAVLAQRFKSNGFVTFAFVLAFLLFSSYFLQILSYIGVYYTISSNKLDLQKQ